MSSEFEQYFFQRLLHHKRSYFSLSDLLKIRSLTHFCKITTDAEPAYKQSVFRYLFFYPHRKTHELPEKRLISLMERDVEKRQVEIIVQAYNLGTVSLDNVHPFFRLLVENLVSNPGFVCRMIYHTRNAHQAISTSEMLSALEKTIFNFLVMPITNLSPDNQAQILSCIDVLQDSHGQAEKTYSLEICAGIRSSVNASFSLLRKEPNPTSVRCYKNLQLAQFQLHNMSKLDLCGANFLGANLDFAVFTTANLEEACFVETSCRDTSFYASNLAKTDFTQAVLHKPKFVKSELADAYFKGTKIFDIEIENSNFDSSDYSEAEFLKLPLEFFCWENIPGLGTSVSELMTKIIQKYPQKFLKRFCELTKEDLRREKIAIEQYLKKIELCLTDCLLKVSSVSELNILKELVQKIIEGEKVYPQLKASIMLAHAYIQLFNANHLKYDNREELLMFHEAITKLVQKKPSAQIAGRSECLEELARVMAQIVSRSSDLHFLRKP